MLDYEMPGFILSKQVHQATQDLDWQDCDHHSPSSRGVHLR